MNLDVSNSIAVNTDKIEKAVENLPSENAQEAVKKGFDFVGYSLNWIDKHGPSFLFAIIFFIIGMIIARKLKKLSKKLMNKSRFDSAIARVLSQVIYIGVIIYSIIIAMAIIGVPTNSFVALIGAAGVAIGLAVQNSIANFASGILILAFKPFTLGDYIETCSGNSGTVENITILHTEILTIDKKIIYIPNSKLTSDYVINYSQNPIRRLIMTIGISYESDHRKAMEVLKDIFKNSGYVYDESTISTGIKNFSDSSLDIMIGADVKNKDYWDAYYKIMQTIKEEFDEKGIDIPYPVSTVHIAKEDTKK